MYHYQLVCHLTSPLDLSYIVSNHKLPYVQIHAHSEYMKEEYWNETKQKSNRCIIRAFYITNFFHFRSIIMAEPFTEFVHNDVAGLNDVIDFFFVCFLRCTCTRLAAKAAVKNEKLSRLQHFCHNMQASLSVSLPPNRYLELCTAVRSDGQLSSLQHCGQKWRTAVKSAALRSEVTDSCQVCSTAVWSDGQLSSLLHCGQKWRTAVKSAALRSEVTDSCQVCSTEVRSDGQLSSLQHCGLKWRTAVKSAALRSEVTDSCQVCCTAVRSDGQLSSLLHCGQKSVTA